MKPRIEPETNHHAADVPSRRETWRVKVLRMIRQLGKYELATLVAMVLLAGGVWAFIEIADEVAEGSANAVDRSILLSLRDTDDISSPLGPEWLEELGRDYTALGGVGVLALVALSVEGYLLLRRQHRMALLMAVAVLGGLFSSLALKHSFDRPRPQLVPHGSFVYTASFPSGHATMSAVTYLTLGALLARAHRRKLIKAYFLLLSACITAAVGVSRVYLGVHWPSDVLAGWTLGACWATITWLVARWFQSSSSVGTNLRAPD